MTLGVDRRRHWDRVFEERGPEGASWFERSPRMSLAMIDLAGVGPEGAVLDVGGGTSPLAGALLARGFEDVTVLDLSEVALRVSRARLGAIGERPHWIHADVVHWIPERTYRLWHDRAVLHFLVEREDRDRYIATARSAVGPGGHVVIGAFADDGPETCSGLPVTRYGAAALAGALGADFDLVACRRDEHRTPAGSAQAFTWVTLRRT